MALVEINWQLMHGTQAEAKTPKKEKIYIKKIGEAY